MSSENFLLVWMFLSQHHCGNVSWDAHSKNRGGRVRGLSDSWGPAHRSRPLCHVLQHTVSEKQHWMVHTMWPNINLVRHLSSSLVLGADHPGCLRDGTHVCSQGTFWSDSTFWYVPYTLSAKQSFCCFDNVLGLGTTLWDHLRLPLPRCIIQSLLLQGQDTFPGSFLSQKLAWVLLSDPTDLSGSPFFTPELVQSIANLEKLVILFHCFHLRLPLLFPLLHVGLFFPRSKAFKTQLKEKIFFLFWVMLFHLSLEARNTGQLSYFNDGRSMS